MRGREMFYLSVLFFIFVLSGCVVRTYPVTRDRVDQVIDEGNGGYLRGKSSGNNEVKERKTTRTTQVVEIELHSPIRFEKAPILKQTEKVTPEVIVKDKEVWGNQGFINEKTADESARPIEKFMPLVDKTMFSPKEYKVQAGDTLQKISKKFYGTTVKWNTIYDANRDVLKRPDKIYPGQIINVPVESAVSAGSLEKPEEYLK